jgi:hypothetical protein
MSRLGDGGLVMPTSDEWRLRARSLNRGLFNPATLRHRHFDGFIASMHQSGTHWIKYMLGLTLARLYDLPPPTRLQDDSIVGHPKSPPLYPQIPQIVHSHSVPHYLLRSRTLFRLLHFPRYLILVRDIRDALVDHYEKFRSIYNVDFSTYLRGDVHGKRYNDDIWVRIRFLNGWGAIAKRHPEHVAVLKYEDLIADTAGQLARVCDHFNIKGVTSELLGDVAAAATKAEMAKLPNPKENLIVVRMDPRPCDEWYSEADRRFVAEVCRRNLKYTFGYQCW